MRGLKNVIFSFLLLSLSVCYPLSGNIVEFEDIGNFKKEAGRLDSNSLVLFDVDYTLIIPKDAILGLHGKKISHKFIAEILENPAIVSLSKYSDGLSVRF